MQITRHQAGPRMSTAVVPGDTVLIHVKKERQRGNVWKFSARAMRSNTIAFCT